MTGGNRGIGLEVLRKLLECEITVVLAARNPESCKQDLEGLLKSSLSQGKIIFEKCDTGELASVRDFAKRVQARFAAVHVLINNGKLKVIFESSFH